MREQAVSLQQALVAKLGIKPPIKVAKPGELQIVVDGKQVFSYDQEGTMPSIDELVARVAAAKA